MSDEVTEDMMCQIATRCNHVKQSHKSHEASQNDSKMEDGEGGRLSKIVGTLVILTLNEINTYCATSIVED